MHESYPIRTVVRTRSDRPRKLAIILLMTCMITRAPGVSPGWPGQTANSQEPSTPELPWKKKTGTPRPPSRSEVTAQQLLKIYGVDDSHLSFLADEQEWSAEAEETTTKILLNLEKENLQNLERWSQAPVPWENLSQAPGDHRIQVFRLRGRAQRIETVPVVKEAAELLKFDHYYRVHVQIEGTSRRAIVVTRHLPKVWEAGQALDERIETSGLFLRVGPLEDKTRGFWFAAPRISWLPDRVAPDSGITSHHVLLADHGVDIGLFSHITRQTRREFIGEERECFYQLLKAVEHAGNPKLNQSNPRSLEIAKLLRNPSDFQGQLFDLEGTARRITRIMIEDPEIQDRFGFDHYYQLDMFVSLAGKSIQIKQSPGDDAAPVFSNRYPVNVCIRSLPPALEKMNQELARGVDNQELLRAHVRLPGFFLKLWSYQTTFAASQEGRGGQLSPVFIAYAPTVVPSKDTRNPFVGTIIGALFVLVLGITWFILWRNSRSDRKFSQTTLQRQRDQDALESLEELGENAN